MQRERSAVPECSARRRVPTWASGDRPLYAPALKPTTFLRDRLEPSMPLTS